MKDYPVGHRFHDGQIPLKVAYPINLNAPCYGCYYKQDVCIASEDLQCAKPSRVFIRVKSVVKVKKNTFWRKIKALLLWYDHFYRDPKNITLLNKLQNQTSNSF